MAEPERVRLEIGFKGGDVLAARVPLANADALEARLRTRDDSIVELEADDARYIVVIGQVLYVKRYARQSRVGFSS